MGRIQCHRERSSPRGLKGDYLPSATNVLTIDSNSFELKCDAANWLKASIYVASGQFMVYKFGQFIDKSTLWYIDRTEAVFFPVLELIYATRS